MEGKIKNADQPAYPVDQWPEMGSDIKDNFGAQAGINVFGLTKREIFALHAMQGILSGQDTEAQWSEQLIAEQAVSQADALLKELNKSK